MSRSARVSDADDTASFNDNFDIASVQSLDSAIMTPTSSSNESTQHPQPAFTSETITNLLKQVENVAVREGSLSENEKSLRLRVESVQRREDAVRKREQELGFRELSPMDKFRLALADLEEPHLAGATILFSSVQAHIFRKLTLHAKTAAKVEDKQAEVSKSAPPNISSPDDNASPPTAVTTSAPPIPGTTLQVGESKMSSNNPDMRPVRYRWTCENGKIQFGKTEEANPGNSTRESPSAPSFKPTFRFGHSDLSISNKPQQTPVSAQPKTSRPESSKLNGIEWPPVDEGRKIHLPPIYGKKAADQATNKLFSKDSAEPKRLFSFAASKSWSQEPSWSECFGNSASTSKATAVPPPPKRTWPIADVTTGPEAKPEPRLSHEQITDDFFQAQKERCRKAKAERQRLKETVRPNSDSCKAAGDRILSKLEAFVKEGKPQEAGNPAALTSTTRGSGSLIDQRGQPPPLRQPRGPPGFKITTEHVENPLDSRDFARAMSFNAPEKDIDEEDSDDEHWADKEDNRRRYTNSQEAKALREAFAGPGCDVYRPCSTPVSLGREGKGKGKAPAEESRVTHTHTAVSEKPQQSLHPLQLQSTPSAAQQQLLQLPTTQRLPHQYRTFPNYMQPLKPACLKRGDVMFQDSSDEEEFGEWEENEPEHRGWM